MLSSYIAHMSYSGDLCHSSLGNEKNNRYSKLFYGFMSKYYQLSTIAHCLSVLILKHAFYQNTEPKRKAFRRLFGEIFILKVRSTTVYGTLVVLAYLHNYT